MEGVDSAAHSRHCRRPAASLPSRSSMSLRSVPLGEGCSPAGACTGSLSTVCAPPLSCSWMRVRPRAWRVASCSSGAGVSGREVIFSSAGNVESAASRHAGAAAREAPLPSLLAGVRWTSAAQASPGDRLAINATARPVQRVLFVKTAPLRGCRPPDATTYLCCHRHRQRARNHPMKLSDLSHSQFALTPCAACAMASGVVHAHRYTAPPVRFPILPASACASAARHTDNR